VTFTKFQFILLFLMGCAFHLKGQIVLNWVNEQYIPSNVNDYDSYSVQALNGNVSKIEEVLRRTNRIEKEVIVTTVCTFLANGKLNHVEQNYADGSISKTWFEYINNYESYYQWWIYLFNTGESLDTIRYDSLGMTEIEPHSDTLFKNEKGQLIYFKLNNDEVYTFYDKVGRKLRDSVATSGQFNHEITYRYRRHKVIKTVDYADHNLTLKALFKIDNTGNWTHCTVKSGRVTNAVIERKITYF